MRNLTILSVLAIRIINRLALYWEKIFQMNWYGRLCTSGTQRVFIVWLPGD
jgi:hypothetical protein